MNNLEWKDRGAGGKANPLFPNFSAGGTTQEWIKLKLEEGVKSETGRNTDALMLEWTEFFFFSLVCPYVPSFPYDITSNRFVFKALDVYIVKVLKLLFTIVLWFRALLLNK